MPPDIKSIPKAELHCHLDGILDLDMAREIHREDPAFPIPPDHFEKAYPVNSYHRFVRWLELVRPIEYQLGYFYPILKQHIHRLKEQRVVYSEIMISGGQLPREPEKAVEKMSAFRDFANQFEDQHFQLEFLIALGRKKHPDAFAAAAERVFALHRAGLIAGVALAGPEEENRVKPFASTFERFHDAGIKIEIHAGEWCGSESVWDALEYGYPDRIGHGIGIFQDPKLLSVIQERGIHVEFCPTSNLKTGSICAIREHPLPRATEMNLSISINTDDPGAFGCSMASEYRLLTELFQFDQPQLNALFRNSLNARFQKDLHITTRMGAVDEPG